MPDKDHSPQLIVYVDGACLMCAGLARRLRRLDPDQRLELIDLNANEGPFTRADLLRELHVVDRAGRVYRGYGAVRRIARALPRLWWAIPALYFPGVRLLGDPLYRASARRRTRTSF